MNIKDNFIYIIESEKNKIFRNKLNQRGKGLIHLKLQKNVWKKFKSNKWKDILYS